jgi:hypothetical protein
MGLASAIASAAACNAGAPAEPAGAPAASPLAQASSFQPNPPSVYVAKVKNILVGLPPTTAEIQTVEGDPTQLASLIDEWMTYPEYTAKMQRFFELAFQQTQVNVTDFADMSYPRQIDVNGSTTNLLVENLQESFARTMIQILSQGQPLTQATTTQTFMMTPAMMELYAFFDAWGVDDANVDHDRFKAANPTLKITAEAAAGPIPISETLDPTSPNYMHWYDPDVANAATYQQNAGCNQDPITYAASAGTLHYLLYGALDGRTSPTGARCLQYGGTAAAPQLTASDFSTWKMVTIRRPNAGESPTLFYDLPTLRSTSELVLTIPRVGFFSTPAFFANWQTNTSNEMRVTTNQALIVALGSSIDGTDTTVPTTTPGLDAQHAAPGTACFSCHQLLDPTRSILSASYSWNYGQQVDPTWSGVNGLFAFRGVIKPVTSVMDFATTLETHPLFASAWAQKLCYYANSTACETSDPEFQRIVTDFVNAGYSWSTLVREILSSPLTTYATSTQTVADQGETVAVSRRDHLCAALNGRLGLTDVCGLLATTKVTTDIPEIVAGLPSDGYGRGAVAPVLPNQPSLFYRAGTENICETVAGLVIDATGAAAGVTHWSSANPNAAIADFVSTVMALTPSDPRSAPATSLLQSHFQAAVASGASASSALKSTFTAACMAPTAVSIGL